MSSKSSNYPAPQEPQLPFGENLTGLPDSIASDKEAMEHIARATLYAKEILDRPEIQMLPLPGQRFISETPFRIPPKEAKPESEINTVTSAEITPRTPAVIGSRARKDLSDTSAPSVEAPSKVIKKAVKPTQLDQMLKYQRERYGKK